MAAILKLPMELKFEICHHLGNTQDLKSLACVGLFYPAATDLIWSDISTQQKCQILMWACAVGSTRAVDRVLEMGTSANLEFQLGGHLPLNFLQPESYLDLSRVWSPATFLCDESSSHTTPTQNTARNGGSHWTPLHVAVKHGHYEVIELLLERGASIEAPACWSCHCTRPFYHNTYRREMYTPLHTALCTHQESIAELLISRGASRYVDHAIHVSYRALGPDRSRFTALHECAIHGLLDTAKFLVEQGHTSAINELDEFGYSPVMYAYCFGQEEIFDFLLAQGASVRATTSDTLSGYHCIDSWKKVKPNFPSLLHQACYDLRWEAVAKLVDHGCDAFERDRNGQQPLQLCVSRFRDEIWTGYRNDTDKEQEELKKMTDIIELYRMHVHIDEENLNNCMKLALEVAMLPVVSLLLDGGMNSSTMLEARKSEGCGGPKGWREPDDTDTDLEATRCHYLDTRYGASEQTILDYACSHYEVRHSEQLDQSELIQLLVSRTDTQPRDVAPVVRALKNICCNQWTDFCVHETRDEEDYDEIIEEIVVIKDHEKEQLRRCAQIICDHLSATLGGHPVKPPLPIDLFYVCVDNGQCIILEELLEVFDLSATEYSEQELWQLFYALTNDHYFEAEAWRPINNLEYLFRLDRGRYLLQHPQAFERLCRCFDNTAERGEMAILDYLDRGGQHCLVFQDGSPALYEVAENNWLQLADRLLDLGADPNKLVSEDDENRYPFWIWCSNGYNVAMLRLFIEKGAYPFQTEGKNLGLGFPFRDCLESDTERRGEFFRELCRLTLNDSTDDGDLFDILELACARGRLKCINEVRSRVGSRVDAMIRNKAVYFLQKLLVGWSYEWSYRWNHIREMDDAIDTMRLILQLGGQEILTSSWRLKIGNQDDTALKLLRRLLTAPPLPARHYDRWTDLHYCDSQDLHQCKVFWCLNERIKFGSGSSTKSLTILGGSIKWPSEWEARSVGPKKAAEVRGTFNQLRICSCEESVL
ncbi:hypothetical protein PG985_002817 [Apiospora marii]|uniref:uncharacterized protein n=1 Tax=Apiospora marii TaxID=335849 RepID=UPI0031310C97